VTRWYAIDPFNGERHISPLSGAPYIFDARVKADAIEHLALHLSHLNAVPMSVCEYAVVRDHRSAAVRAKAWDDLIMARAKTWPIPADPDEELGQLSLCADVEMWRAA
jgi:hypothetical protein